MIKNNDEQYKTIFQIINNNNFFLNNVKIIKIEMRVLLRCYADVVFILYRTGIALYLVRS